MQKKKTLFFLSSLNKTSLILLHQTSLIQSLQALIMSMKNGSSRRAYSNKFKLQVITLANQVGNREAARQLSINSKSSIRDDEIELENED